MVRKIDNMGRIVIPKEIRYSMNLKDGDDLLIFTQNDEITLKKYSIMDNNLKKSIILTDAFNELVDGNIIVADREKIITPGVLFNHTLPSKIQNLAITREYYFSPQIEELRFGNTYVKAIFSIFPIITNSNVIGYVILISNNIISDEERKYLKVIENIIENT